MTFGTDVPNVKQHTQHTQWSTAMIADTTLMPATTHATQQATHATVWRLCVPPVESRLCYYSKSTGTLLAYADDLDDDVEGWPAWQQVMNNVGASGMPERRIYGMAVKSNRTGEVIRYVMQAEVRQGSHTVRWVYKVHNADKAHCGGAENLVVVNGEDPICKIHSRGRNK